METIFIETEFARVHARTAGDHGNPLILAIHGWSQRNGWHTWEPLLAPLAEGGYYVVSVDMPGWGGSKLRGASLRDPAQAVTAVLQILDNLQRDTAVLMGKSWGGGIALEVARQHPLRVSKLILTAPAHTNISALRGLNQPVLLAWAEDDPVIPISSAAAFGAAIPDLQRANYPTGGHSAAPQNAADFAPRAVSFLQA
jgi:pimeloyl-ACP methyl ester carboxylesterase